MTWNMSSVCDLYFHIKTLNIFGLVCCSYRCDNAWELSHSKWHRIQALCTLVVVHILTCPMLVCGILTANDFRIISFNKIGDRFFVVHFELSALLLLILYWYFYIQQWRNFEFLQIIFRFHHECGKETASWQHRTYYLMYFLNCAIATWMYLFIFAFSQMPLVTTFSYMLVFIATTWISGILLLMHLSVMRIMQRSMRYLNQELRTLSFADFEKLKNILSQRNMLLHLALRDMNRNYGFVFLLIMGFVMATGASGPFYIVSQYMVKWNERPAWFYILITFNNVIWNSPVLRIFHAMSACDGFNREVNMAEIILSIPAF